jgi:two-component system, OmpR family, sensor histidine kinase CreC
MSFGLRVTIVVLGIFAIAMFSLSSKISKEMRFRYLEGVEESLVDQSNTLAEILADFVVKNDKNISISLKNLHSSFNKVQNRKLNAKIFKLTKTTVDSSIYITNNKGIVLFDSKFPQNEGANFMDRRDVDYSLQGKYGARFSRGGSKSHFSSILFVSAPIVVKGEIWGVVTIRKPTTNIDIFLHSAQNQVRWVFFVVAAFLLVTILLSVWFLSRPLSKLTYYAMDVRDGLNPQLPPAWGKEEKKLGQALREMRKSLEGKKYVEEYVEILTHEMKSPITAIRGAAELLSEKMHESQREKFIGNILQDAKRLSILVDRMLSLTKIEHQEVLDTKKSIDLNKLLSSMCESFKNKKEILTRNINIQISMTKSIKLIGDPLLLHQLFENLLGNALEFSSDNGSIQLKMSQTDQTITIKIKDNGSGIPEYALKKVFLRFFSLDRPKTGKKSTGLGLNFAQEVAKLHNGNIKLKNNKEKGVTAIVTIPSKSS